MANEITLSVSMQVTKGFLEHKQNPGSIQVTMTGTKACGGAAATTTSYVALDVLPLLVTELGYAYFRNTSSVAIEVISVGIGGVPFLQLGAGEFALLRLPSTSTTLQIKSASGTPVLQYWIIQN